jgi:hypothetical protein
MTCRRVCIIGEHEDDGYYYLSENGLKKLLEEVGANNE